MVLDYLKYVENKAKYLSDFEKEGKRHLSKCTIDNPKDADFMANCFLGYKEKFKINIEEFYAPFSILNKNSISNFTDHRATITPHNDELPKFTVCFGISRFGKQYKFIGTLYHTPEITNLPKKLRIKCNLFDIVIELDSRRMTARIFSDDTEIEFKQLHDFVCFLNDMSNSQKTLVKLIDHASGHTTEVCMDNPIFCLPDNFDLIYSTIKSIYRKFCGINIENNIISTQYILNNISKLNLFSLFGEKYDPDYFLEFKDNKNHVSEANALVFSFTIFFKEIKFITFVAFYGSIEISSEKMLRCRFKKSEVLDNYHP